MLQQNRYFYSLREVKGLVYVFGYIFKEVNFEVDDKYYIFSQHGFSVSYFVYNFNFGILLVLPAIVCILVFSYKIREQNQKNPQVAQEQQSQRIVELTKYLRFGYHSLYYLLLGLLVPFMEFVVVFVEIGDKGNIISWIIVGLYVMLFVFIKLMFFNEPTYFEIFWFSFRIHKILLHNYFIYVGGMIVGVVLLILFPMKPYLSVVVFVLMLVYLMLFRPYIEMKHNIRMCMNNLVICSFLFYNFYVLSFPERGVFPIGADIYLGVNVFLIFMILMVSNGMQIYKIFIEYFKNGKELKRRQKQNKILSELSKATLSDKMKKMRQQNRYFENLISPMESIFDYSNRLLREQVNNTVVEGEQTPQGMLKGIKESLRLNRRESRPDDGIVYGFGVRDNFDQGVYVNQMGQGSGDEEEIAEQVLRNENRFINTKCVVEKVEGRYGDVEKERVRKEENDYLKIYDGIGEVKKD